MRRALSLAIDRSRIVRDVLHGGEKPAYRLIPPPIELASSFSAPGPEGFRSDAAEARRLWPRETGFAAGRNFPGLELSGWTGAAAPVLEAIQAMWKKNLGVKVALVMREARVHVSALRSGNYDIAYITLIPDVADPLSILENFTFDSPNNYPHWADPACDRLCSLRPLRRPIRRCGPRS